MNYMEVFYSIILFFIVLFAYVHIMDVFKKSEDLEIYEMDYTSPKALHEVCAIRQPLLFSLSPNMASWSTIDSEDSELFVKDNRDYAKPNMYAVDPIVLSKTSAKGLCETDTNKAYYTEGNFDFVANSSKIYDKLATTFNGMFKPPLTAQTKFDIWFGSKGCQTPLKYHIYSRQYIYVAKGCLRLKLTPWRSRVYLFSKDDYENLEFWSPVNPWAPSHIHSDNFAKLRFLDVEVFEGQVFFLPPYWWYSVEYSNQDDNLAFVSTYNTAMNLVAYLPTTIRHYMQHQNITHRPSITQRPQNSEEKNEPVAEVISEPNEIEKSIDVLQHKS